LLATFHHVATYNNNNNNNNNNIVVFDFYPLFILGMSGILLRPVDP